MKVSASKDLIVAELQLRLKKSKVKSVKIGCSSDLVAMVRPFFSCINYQEEMKVVHLDHYLQVVGIQSISVGGQTSCIVDKRIIFGGALMSAATSIVLVHNHPSGNLSPSAQDKSMTKEMVEAGKLLDIKVIDHLILTEESYFSFSDEDII